MTIVMKNSNNAAAKIKKVLNSLDITETSLTIIVSRDIHKNIEDALKEIGLGQMKYGKETLYLNKQGIGVSLTQVDKYV